VVVIVGSHILPAAVVHVKTWELEGIVVAGQWRHVEGQDGGAEGCWRVGRRMLAGALRAIELFV
jgi:hypothetical protein